MKDSMAKFGIGAKITISMLLVSLVPILLIWTVTHRAMIDTVSEQVHGELLGVTTRLTQKVNGWVDMNRRMLVQNAALEKMRSMNAAEQNPILRDIVEVYDWNYLAFTVAPDGRNIGRSDGNPPKYYGDRSYVKQVLSGEDLGEQVLIGKTSGKPALVLAAPIRETDGRIAGVLAIAMTITEISDAVTNLAIGETGYAFLLDKNGQVIAHQTKEFEKIRKDFSDHPAFVAMKERGENRVVFEDENGEKTVAYMMETERGWVLAARQTYGEAFGKVKQLQMMSLIILLIAAITIIMVSLLLAKNLATPIKRLTTVADQLSTGDMNVTIEETRRGDEIGVLARAIERLGVSVKYAMDRLRK